MPASSSIAAEVRVLAQLAAGERDHRAHPQRLVDNRVQVFVLARGELGLEPLERIGPVKQQVEGPGQTGRRGLVSGEQQGHQLVAQLAILHRRAILEPGREQHREDVVALGEIGAAAVLGDLGIEELVGARAQLGEAAEHRQLAHARSGKAQGNGRGARRKDRDQSVAESLAAVGVLDSEHGAQDHLEGDLLHARVKGELGPLRPAGDGALGRLADHLLIAAHALTVEGRQHQLAPAQMLLVFLQEQRGAAEQRLEQDVSPGCNRVHTVGGEQSLDRVRIGEEDDVAGAEQPGAEGLAELSPPMLEKRDRAEDEARRLQRLRQRDCRHLAIPVRPRAGRGRLDGGI